ncbi:AMP-binding protein [Terricaulis sp.]|uniref:AMP-binding protein n=1 Tax=Terricaulis sp. TaxID=2768686 RepID=UPI002AC44FF0|nr:AMP-binding protein [Terricaulis sp.]MDZ4691812.1 AMP-binding protein [Terricaulis sp.]
MSAVLAAIARHALERPDFAALVGGGFAMNYAQLDAAVSELAHTLASELGDGRGCVALALDNSPAWVLIDLAVMKLSRPCLPLPTFFTPAQVDATLHDAGAQWLLTSDEQGKPLQVAHQTVWLQRLDGSEGRLHPGTAKVTYTSGSTGAPKGVCLSLPQMEQVAQSIVTRFGVSFAGVHAPILPLGVLLENVAGLYSVLLAGGCYHVQSAHELGCDNPFKPDFARMGAALRAARATSLILVPELMRGIMAARAFGVMELPALDLIAVGGAKVAPELIAMARGLSMPVYEGYGLTECASVVAVNAPNGERGGSVGRPLDHIRAYIAADGEIIIGDAGFLGYAGHAAKSGPTHTGDIGELDEDGFLYVKGRKDNLIITSFGRNVSPEWVECELLAEPVIRHALVFGEGRPELRALIAPIYPGLERDVIAASVERANARLPAYARIGGFEVLGPLSADAGDLTGNGRVRRNAVLAKYSSFVNG